VPDEGAPTPNTPGDELPALGREWTAVGSRTPAAQSQPFQPVCAAE